MQNNCPGGLHSDIRSRDPTNRTVSVTMNTRTAFLLATLFCVCDPMHAAEPLKFPKVDGRSIKGLFVDVDKDPGGRVFVTYARNSDSGAEVIRRSKDGNVVWRTFVESLMVDHSAYQQEVSAWVEGDALHVKIEGYKIANEVIDLKTGKQLSRKVTEKER